MAAPRLSFVVLALVSLALTGCSGEDPESEEPSPSATASVSGSATASGSSSGSSTSSSSSSSSSPTSTGTPQPQTIQKDVLDNSFPDGTFTIRAGDTVVWTHRGTNLHSVSSDSFDSHPNCPPVCMLGGQTFTHEFATAGTFEYRCKVHGGMTGTVTVT
jgi:plastocyanin